MDTLQLQHLLATAAWDADFDEAAMRRGRAYFHAGRVIALHHQQTAGVDVLLAVVRGSALEPYRCIMRLVVHQDALRVQGECSCPVVSGCKHIVAGLSMASTTAYADWPGSRPAAGSASKRAAASAGQASQTIGSMPRDPLPRWTRWLQSLPDPAGQRPLYTAADGRQFGVLLRGDGDHPAARLLVNPVWLRPGRGGARSNQPALVDPQPVLLNPQHGPVPTPLAGWPASVATALAALLQEVRITIAGQHWIPITADYQEQALEAVLAAGYPAFHERGSTVLTRGPLLSLQCQWHDESDGDQRLVASIDSDVPALLLRGARLWYVQPQTGRFGLTDGDARWVAALAAGPSVPPEEVTAVREQLARAASTASLPLPTERGPVERLDCTPIPVLQLRLLGPRRGHVAAADAIGCARLAWDYGPVRVERGPRDGLVRSLQHGRVYEVQRQRAAELTAEGPLRAAGLQQIAWLPEPAGIDPRQLASGDLLLQPTRQQPPLPASAWAPVLEQLQAAGFRLDYGADFPRQRDVAIDAWHADVEPHGSQWFDVSLGIDVGGDRVDLLPLLRRMLGDPAFPLRRPADEPDDASWTVALDQTRSVQMPLARLRALLEPLLEWLQGDNEGLRMHRTGAAALVAMGEEAHIPWRGGDLLRAQLDSLQRARRSAETPDTFRAQLRPYQSEGLAWLDFLADSGLGGILADDMGLGKTVQVLAHLVSEQQRGRLQLPALVVAPTSLVGNWRDETARFAPTLKVLVLHGANRAVLYEQIPQHDLVITTYPLLPRDEARLREARFSLLVLDEAQAIKNPRSQAARVVRTIPAIRRLAMTGTPLENHLGELWAQFDAVEPGLLGSERQFNKLYRTPIEKHADQDRQQRLNRRISALLLRRRKQDVLTDLPAKTEIVLPLELAGAQRTLYETLRLAQHERVRQAVQERGLSQAGIIVLDALLKLRQACCDPRLVKLPSARRIGQSAKLEALLQLLDGLLLEGRRILVFSQFTEMLALIEDELVERQIAYQILTGQTPARERTALVAQFQAGAVPVFLVSLKAGGVGLNLTAADTVIHYDPWWNPAAEAQATDRAHRIGQQQSVFVYRLICTGTVEEKIQSLQVRKGRLAQAVLDGGGASTHLRFDEADLAELFAPL